LGDRTLYSADIYRRHIFIFYLFFSVARRFFFAPENSLDFYFEYYFGNIGRFSWRGY